MIQLCRKLRQYPDPDSWLPVWALDGYTDTAERTNLSLGSGCGTVLWGWWTWRPWSNYINKGAIAEGDVRQALEQTTCMNMHFLETIIWGSCLASQFKPLQGSTEGRSAHAWNLLPLTWDFGIRLLIQHVPTYFDSQFKYFYIREIPMSSMVVLKINVCFLTGHLESWFIQGIIIHLDMVFSKLMPITNSIAS